MRIDENRERIERVEASELGGVRESETKKSELNKKKVKREMLLIFEKLQSDC